MGFSPHCHVGDGCVDVILVRHTSFFNNIRMLLRLSSKQKTLVRDCTIVIIIVIIINPLITADYQAPLGVDSGQRVNIRV